MRPTLIYVLTEDDGTPRYIGKTRRLLMKRFWAHRGDARREGVKPSAVQSWLLKRDREGRRTRIFVVERVSPRGDWPARERHWIAEYRRRGHRLLNMTDGGDGALGRTGVTAAQSAAVAAAVEKRKTGCDHACLHCGAIFYRGRGRIVRGHNKYCSRPCKQAAQLGVSTPLSPLFVERGRVGALAEAERRKARTHCDRGHPYSPENLVQGLNYRACLTCRRAAQSRRYREVVATTRELAGKR